jgi:[acyl-carrier-protein] S-malonyltransferase
LLALASDILKVDLTGFDFRENDFLDDELKSQYISYIFSCSMANILKSREVRPAFVSGYSMGIYAALFYIGSVTFKDGLLMVKRAWEKISEVTAGGKYGMGMIVGLSEADILDLLHGSMDVRICNQNNIHTFIISGNHDAVLGVLSSAKAEGALRANLLPVSKPYHSDFIAGAVPGFTEIIGKFKFRDPAYKYISNISQEIITASDGLRKEVINNLYSRMNWFNAMNFLLSLGADVFFECGTGDGLTRNFRFIEGNFKSFSVSNLDDFLKTVSD